jgi:hypothetical protein
MASLRRFVVELFVTFNHFVPFSSHTGGNVGEVDDVVGVLDVLAWAA